MAKKVFYLIVHQSTIHTHITHVCMYMLSAYPLVIEKKKYLFSYNFFVDLKFNIFKVRYSCCGGRISRL